MRADRLLQVLSFLMLIGIAVYVVTFTQAQRERSECESAVNAQFREDLTVLAGASGPEREALLVFLTTAFAEDATDTRTRDELARWTAVVAAANDQRARAPLADQTTCS